MNSVKIKEDKDWEELLFDLSFIEQYGYSNWSEMNVIDSGNGWLLSEKNRLEIKQGRRKRSVSMNEYLGEGELFDSFTKKVEDYSFPEVSNSQLIFLAQIDIGLINKFSVDTEKVLLDELQFNLFNGSTIDLNMVWLKSIERNSKELKDLGSDCLTQSGLIKLLP